MDLTMEEDFAEKLALEERSSNKAHFVLIHGIGGGGWCWYKIRCLLEIFGYRVSCIDLKGAGIDQTDPNTVLSFEDYNKPLINFLSSLDDKEKVILVGHSAGGLSLTDAIHKLANKISLAVFIAATMLKTGFVTDQDIKDGVPDLFEFGKFDDVCDLGFGLGQDCPPTTMIIKKELQRKIIYHLSPKEDSTLSAMLLRPGPIQALTSAQFVMGENSEQVPRIYIKTTHDLVLKTEQQDAMTKKWPPSDVYTLETDHSPYFSAPISLVGLLVNAAISIGCN